MWNIKWKDLDAEKELWQCAGNARKWKRGVAKFAEIDRRRKHVQLSEDTVLEKCEASREGFGNKKILSNIWTRGDSWNRNEKCRRETDYMMKIRGANMKKTCTMKEKSMKRKPILDNCKKRSEKPAVAWHRWQTVVEKGTEVETHVRRNIQKKSKIHVRYYVQY